jgi:type II secretory pathway predicted ATPase ExeA
VASPVSLQLHDAPRYEEFYGFVHAPFAPAQDSRAVYASRAYEAAISLVLDSIRRREAFTILTGDSGVGKTTICRTLGGRLETATVTSLVLEPSGSAEDLLRKVLLDFGVISRIGLAGGRAAVATQQELAATLRGFLRSLAAINASGALIVDDAHQLSPGVLRQIGDFAAAGTAESDRLAVVLVGEPALLDRLEAADAQDLSARISARAPIEPLARDEIAPYIGHRLAAAGAAGAPTFSQAAAEVVYQCTHGVPAAIDKLCERSLMLGAQLDIRVIGPEVVDEAARGVDRPSASPVRPGLWARVPLWIWIAVPILLLLALIAVSFSGTA